MVGIAARTSSEVPHIVEIREMVSGGHTLRAPACLFCGWVGGEGPRPPAERG
jgi:hypothetical protein